MLRRFLVSVSCLFLTFLISCSESTISQSSAGTAATQAIIANEKREASLVRVIDGDTVVVILEGEEVRVRLVGIDTPELGECGFSEAAQALESLLMSGNLGLIDAGVDDRDRFNRLLRYLDVDGLDPGLELIRLGLAEAAYDSRTGFRRHDREELYLATDSLPSRSC
jgi:micrococcal nuclease